MSLSGLPSCWAIIVDLAIGLFALSVGAAILLLPVAAIWARRRGLHLSHRSLRLRTAGRRVAKNGLRDVWRTMRPGLPPLLRSGAGMVIAVYLYGSIWLVSDPLHSCVYPGTRTRALLLFDLSDLRAVWAIHATIIAFALVGLSFAWESIRGLETELEIIREIAGEMRSIATISFLLTANALLGLVVLTARNQLGPQTLFPALGLFIASILLIVWSSAKVLDTLLFQSIHQKVMALSQEHIARLRRWTPVASDDLLVESAPELADWDLGRAVWMNPNDYTSVTAEDINAGGEITDIHLGRLGALLRTLQRDDCGDVVAAHFSLGARLAPNTTVLAVEGNAAPGVVEELRANLRRSIRTREGTP